MSTLTVREMTELYNAGSTLSTIAKQCDSLGSQGVRYRLKKAGITLRKRGPVPKKTATGQATRIAVRKSVRTMVNDYHAGLTLRQIGKKHHVSHETVRNNLKKNGVSLRDVRGRKLTNITVAVPAPYVKMFIKVTSAFGAKRL